MAIVVTPPITFWILAGEGPDEAAAYLIFIKILIYFLN
jgi:hypothetical protein